VLPRRALVFPLFSAAVVLLFAPPDDCAPARTSPRASCPEAWFKNPDAMRLNPPPTALQRWPAIAVAGICEMKAQDGWERKRRQAHSAASARAPRPDLWHVIVLSAGDHLLTTS